MKGRVGFQRLPGEGWRGRGQRPSWRARLLCGHLVRRSSGSVKQRETRGTRLPREEVPGKCVTPPHGVGWRPGGAGPAAGLLSPL